MQEETGGDVGFVSLTIDSNSFSRACLQIPNCQLEELRIVGDERLNDHVLPGEFSRFVGVRLHGDVEDLLHLVSDFSHDIRLQEQQNDSGLGQVV